MTIMATDIDYLVRKSVFAGYQFASLLAPPVYIIYTLSQHGRGALSLNRTLRATWVAGAAGGAAGAGVELIRSSRDKDSDSLVNRRIQAVYDTSLIRRDDHATIGSLLFALITPAIFWKRARTIHLILGGAGIGTAIGISTHYLRTLTGDPPPKATIPVIAKTSQ